MKYLLLILTLVSLSADVVIDHYRFGGTAPGNGLLTDLAAYYRFEEAATNNALDSSVNGYDLTVSNSLDSVSGAILQGRNHASSEDNDFFSRADASWQHFGSTNFTVTFWYRPNAPSGISKDQTFIAKGDSDLSWMVLLDRGSYDFDFAFVFYYTTDGGIPIALLTLPIVSAAAEEEYFVYVRRNGTTFDMGYAVTSDIGIPNVVSATASVTIWDSPNKLTVGTWMNGLLPNPEYDVEGMMDELGIWNNNLSDCQIGKLKNKLPFVSFDSNSCL
jgi:hypothetical protein